MPAHRKPTSVLAFTGAFKTNPSRARARAGEPVPRGPIGEPPSGLAPEVESAWREIVALCPAGVLGDCDIYVVEAAANLAAQVRAGGADPATFAQLLRFLSALGMTPESRSRVKVTPPAEDVAKIESFTGE